MVQRKNKYLKLKWKSKEVRLKAYQAEVYKRLAPHLTAEEAEWLKKETTVE